MVLYYVLIRIVLPPPRPYYYSTISLLLPRNYALSPGVEGGGIRDANTVKAQRFGTSDLFNEYHETALLLVVSGLVMIGKQTGIRLQAYVNS